MIHHPVKKLLTRMSLLLAVAVAMYFMVQQVNGCVLRQITGIPCPTCGMTRAWYAAFALRFVDAFCYHPMFWGVPALAILYLLDGFPIPGIRGSRIMYIVLLVGFVATYFCRLLFYFSGVSTV